MNERMPPLAPEAMSEAQKSAAAELTAGPRGGANDGPCPAVEPRVAERLAGESRNERGGDDVAEPEGRIAEDEPDGSTATPLFDRLPFGTG